MAERLKFRPDEIEEVLRKVTELVLSCRNVSKFSITLKDVIEKDTTKIKDIVKPTINIPASIYTKMFQLVEESSTEISWHGLVNRDKENQIYTIYDILLFPQINTSTTTTTDEDKFAEWTQRLIMDMNFPIQDLRLHGHSHVNMGVFSSSVDDTYQNDILAKLEDGDYYLFLILNKRHDICALLYDYDQQILFTTGDIDIVITDDSGINIKQWAKDQIKQFCEEKKTGYKKQNYTYSSTKQLNIYNDDDIYLGSQKVIPKKNYRKDKK